MNEPTIRDVLEAIQVFSTHVDQQFDIVDKRFSAIDGQFLSIDQRFDVVDGRLNRLEQQYRDLVSVVATKQDLKELVTKEYLEGRLAHIR